MAGATDVSGLAVIRPSWQVSWPTTKLIMVAFPCLDAQATVPTPLTLFAFGICPRYFFPSWKAELLVL